MTDLKSHNIHTLLLLMHNSNIHITISLWKTCETYGKAVTTQLKVFTCGGSCFNKEVATVNSLYCGYHIHQTVAGLLLPKQKWTI